MDPVKRKRTTVLKSEVPVLPKAKAKAKPKAKAKAKPKPKIKTVANPETVPKKKVVTEWVNKVHIPKKVRTDVWNTFIGPSIPIHKCLCCLKTTICMTDFQVGHVVSEHDGGNLNIDNLRPICASCNISMGTTNMKDYVLKYGYLI
jgi:5-methylcytosine-specific restriction endonuclease McrA